MDVSQEVSGVMGDDRQSTNGAAEAVGAFFDQLEAAKRELEIAEEARRTRAEEVEKAATELEASLATAIEEVTTERDDLKVRLQETEKRLHDLEATKTQARLARFSTTPPAQPPADHGSTAAPDEPVGAGAQPESGTGETEASYEDGWYEVMKNKSTSDADAPS